MGTVRDAGVPVMRWEDGRGKAISVSAEGGRPWPVKSRARVAGVARAEPLLFGGFADPGEVIDRARGLVPDLPHIQVVGVHVVPGGWAVLPDGRLAAPEEFAEVV
ncbi:hypothetical protein ACWDKQ_35930, partial [Saccharopolyspora sp. NPDC000995]